MRESRLVGAAPLPSSPRSADCFTHRSIRLRLAGDARPLERSFASRGIEPRNTVQTSIKRSFGPLNGSIGTNSNFGTFLRGRGDCGLGMNYLGSYSSS